MRILLDENIPEAIGPDFPGHECLHSVSLGWAGVKNGALLKLAQEEAFEAFLTFDRGIEHQQNLEHLGLFIVILAPEGQGIQALRQLIPQIQHTLETAKIGEVHVVSNRNP